MGTSTAMTHRPRLHSDPPTSAAPQSYPDGVWETTGGVTDEESRQDWPTLRDSPGWQRTVTGPSGRVWHWRPWPRFPDAGTRREIALAEPPPLDPDPLRPPEPEPPSVPELAHWAATGRPPRRFLPEPDVDELASAWRSCLVRAGLLALALILVGLAAGLVGRAS